MYFIGASGGWLWHGVAFVGDSLWHSWLLAVACHVFADRGMSCVCWLGHSVCFLACGIPVFIPVVVGWGRACISLVHLVVGYGMTWRSLGMHCGTRGCWLWRGMWLLPLVHVCQVFVGWGMACTHFTSLVVACLCSFLAVSALSAAGVCMTCACAFIGGGMARAWRLGHDMWFVVVPRVCSLAGAA